MPPQPKRNRCVILYDLNSRNQRQLRRALLKIYSHQYFCSSKDLVNLVLVNSKNTKNRKNQKWGRGYENIYEISQEGHLYDPTFVYDKIEVTNTNTANWREALCVAIQILKEDETSRIITHQILYLSDLCTVSQSDESIIDIVNELNVNSIFLYIIGPEVQFPRAVTNFQELKPLIEHITFNQTNDNLNEAKEMILRCDNAVMADVKMGLQFFFNYKNPNGKQIWTVPLTVGSKIVYDAGTSKLMDKSKGFQLKQKHKIFKSPVFMSTQDSTKEYAVEDVRKGILKHGKFIPLDNNEIFKVKLERMLSLVFVTKIKFIPEYMMKGPACYTVAAPKESSSIAFYSLLIRLNELESCLIVKRVYNRGCVPIYLALLPVTSKKCFRAVQLPYGSHVPFEWMEQEPAKDEVFISEPVVNFLQCLTIESKNFSLNCPMTPNILNSSRGRALENRATEKLLQEPNLHLEEVDLDPFSTGIDSEIGRELREIWPSREPPNVVEEAEDDESDHEDYNDYF
ncbi:uncharacterized protein LOC123316727 [Coccinella septempunctata]|uniref:uncharacterized protein LOC123316727 n=1 Tax=Coccinella septempunctata TaxID=41139 RepID=UPI001D0912E5|nr:uncharacterized protein LOC123316727 [Coccinella septempunctata]